VDKGLSRPQIYVIGIGYKPFDKRTKEIIMKADAILASERLFDVFARHEEFEPVRDRVEVINNVDATMNFIRSHVSGGRFPVIVLLASGDPLFYGIGRRTVEEFGKEMVEILPDLSSVQLAFARIKEPWDDAFLMSVHHGPEAAARRKPKYGIKDIPSLLEEHEKIAILTDKENNPAVIAGEILSSAAASHDLSAITMFICEKLGYSDERIIQGTPGEIVSGEFSYPNVVIIMKQQQH
jgi:precorrin-6Y C5,15-methyltransferase (decarboxylating)